MGTVEVEAEAEATGDDTPVVAIRDIMVLKTCSMDTTIMQVKIIPNNSSNPFQTPPSTTKTGIIAGPAVLTYLMDTQVPRAPTPNWDTFIMQRETTRATSA